MKRLLLAMALAPLSAGLAFATVNVNTAQQSELLRVKGLDKHKAKAIIADVIAADDRCLKDPAVTIALSELADSSVNFVVRPWVKASDYWGVYFDTHETIKKRFDAEGVSIPFPQQDVHMHQVTA